MEFSKTKLYMHTSSGDVQTESMWADDLIGIATKEIKGITIPEFETFSELERFVECSIAYHNDAEPSDCMLEELELNEAEQLMVNKFGEDLILNGKIMYSEILHEARDRAENGSSSVYMFVIDGKHIFVERGDNESIGIYECESIRDFVNGWDHGDQTWYQFASEWGWNVTPDEAANDAEKVRIWCSKNYSSGTLGTNTYDCYLTDDRGDEIIFDTYADAQNWINESESEPYFLSHGEMGRPVYYIVD